MINTYDKGDLVRLSSSFKSGGEYVDPTTVKFYIKDPSAKITTYEYGVGTDINKGSTGNYYIELVPSLVGIYYYKWESTGVGQSVEEGRFVVRFSNF
jgi:hypothetical protein